MTEMLTGKTIVVAGLMDNRSIAWAIGEAAAAAGATVMYTVQRKAMLRGLRDSIPRDRYDSLMGANLIITCDVTKAEELTELHRRIATSDFRSVDGLVHCIGYANPGTCLSGNMIATPESDVMAALQVSAVSLQRLTATLYHVMNREASVVAMTFESQQAFPNYDWMGVAKAALEATARGLNRQLGPGIGGRINCISAGPMETMAAEHIPGFEQILDIWNNEAPMGWDPDAGKETVANTAVFLLSDASRCIGGQVIHVDGGFSSVRVANP